MAKLEKASIIIYDNDLSAKSMMHVQFNPSEYSISRNISASSKRRVGSDQKLRDKQPVAGHLATLSVTLYFDSVSDLDHITLAQLGGGIKSLVTGGLGVKDIAAAAKNFYTSSDNHDVRAVCNEISQLLRYDIKLGRPPNIGFLWGSMSFGGMLSSTSLEYTMFSPDGIPVRAKMSISITGEEMSYITEMMGMGGKGTGQITMGGTDQLWQTANRTSGSPGNWKKLASDNGVMNPRKSGGAKMLKWK